MSASDGQQSVEDIVDEKLGPLEERVSALEDLLGSGWVSCPAAAKLIGKSPVTVRRYLRSGAIPPYDDVTGEGCVRRHGRNLRFRSAWLLENVGSVGRVE